MRYSCIIQNSYNYTMNQELQTRARWASGQSADAAIHDYVAASGGRTSWSPSWSVTSHQKWDSSIVYLKNNPAKFHPDPIWNDTSLGFLNNLVPTTIRTIITTRWVAIRDQFLILYTVSQKKTSHFNFRHKFAICWDIFTIFEAFCSGIINAWQSI